MANNSARKKGKSIARRIYAMLVGKLFLAFLFTDLLVLVGICSGYLHYQCETSMGSIKNLSDIRIESLTGESQVIELVDKSRTVYSLDITRPVDYLQRGSFFLLCCQGFLLLFALCFDYYRVRGRLRPLALIAENAENLSQLSFDESRLLELETAISQVSPVTPGSQVVTHDRELQGIESALNSLLERMRDAYRQQGRFVSDASHELRTPIAVIKGYVDMLDRWGAEDPQVLSESITAIKNETNHMNRLVEQLLFLARGDSGRNPISMENFSLSQMVTEVFEESQMIDEAHRYELKRDASDVFVYGDSSMLKQALRILMDNAAKYTHAGDTITLRVGVNPDYQPFFSVQDNGIGMQQQDVVHIFERFYRSDKARNSQTGGTGLGLSIAKWIVDRHQGNIEVISRPEIGTRFTVCLKKVC